MSLAVGDAFPTLPVESADGPVDLSERWARGPLIIAFRRLWCPFCQESLKQLEAVEGELRQAGGDAVVVYRAPIDKVHSVCTEGGVPFDCLSDPGHDLERAAAVERYPVGRYLAPSVPRRLVQALRAGGRVGLITTDILQGRDTYVVGPDGRVAYGHVSAHVADIPDVAELLGAVRDAAPRA